MAVLHADEIRARVEADFDRIVDVLNKKIALQSISAKGITADHMKQSAQFVAEELNKVGVDAHVVQSHNPDGTPGAWEVIGSKVAKLLRGKYKPDFTPHADCGDNVIIINADKVKFTGNKWNDKVYLRYTGYPGGQREMTPAQLMKKPNGEEKLLKRVVKGMLPKNRLGAQLLGNLYVYAGSEHKHEAQTPKSIDINSLK